MSGNVKKRRTAWAKPFIALSVGAALLASPGLAAPAAAAAATSAYEDAADYSLFLEEKYAIDYQGVATKGQYLESVADVLGARHSGAEVAFRDLNADGDVYPAAAALYEQGVLTADTVGAEKKLTPAAAVFVAVKAAGLQELANTYPQEKIDRALAKLKRKSAALTPQAAKELAAAVDTGLLPAEYYGEFYAGAGQPASPELIETLLGKILTFNGKYKRYIGYVSDHDIVAKLTAAYASSGLIAAPELRDAADAALRQNLVTGYNLKDSRFDPNFVQSLSLTYGHDNLKHAIQLIGLLRSEHIDAKVQFEPKTSAFIYLKEWGEPQETEDYRVVQIENGNYIAYAKEYDISFEFERAADKEKFDAIVTAYAKKDSDDEPNLLAGSWWQPLYYSLTELDNYEVITNNKFSDGRYYVQSFSLNDDAAAVAEGFRRLAPDAKTESYRFWVDKPFFRYLNGESE